MTRLKINLALLGVAVAAGVAAYQLLLTDEAKHSLRMGVDSLGHGFTIIRDLVEERRGLIMDDDQPLPNVQKTKQDWEALGY